MRNYSGDGLFWWATKKKCQKLDPYAIHFDDRKKSCKKKDYPIKLKYSNGSEYSFTVTDEKLEKMQEDGTLQQLQTQGAYVHGGADPLYFDWHNKIANEIKNTGKRTNSQYMKLYPYLELYTLEDINFKTGQNSLQYLTQIGSDFYSGDSLGRRHEATLRFIKKTSDTVLLENAKKRYENVLENMYQANSNPTQNVIEQAFNQGLELLGSNPVTGILTFGYEKIKRLVRVMTNINEQELKAINKRLLSKKTIFPFLSIPLLPTLPSGEIDVVKKQKQDDVAIGILGGSSLLLLWALL
jgi:hypothetical protein